MPCKYHFTFIMSSMWQVNVVIRLWVKIHSFIMLALYITVTVQTWTLVTNICYRFFGFCNMTGEKRETWITDCDASKENWGSKLV